MRVLTKEDGALLSHIYKTNETQSVVNITSLKHILIDNHEEANRVKIIDQLPLEHMFVFYKTLKNITINLGFHLTFEAASPQGVLYTTIGGYIIITLNNLYLYVPVFNPSAGTQAMFKHSIKNNYKISFDPWYTDRQMVNDGLDFQVDIGRAQYINSPKYLIGGHLTNDRLNKLKKQRKIAISDNLDVRNYFCEIDGQRYLKDAVIIGYAENDYLGQYRDLKLLY